MIKGGLDSIVEGKETFEVTQEDLAKVGDIVTAKHKINDEEKNENGAFGVEAVKECIDVVADIALVCRKELSDGFQITDAIGLMKGLIFNGDFRREVSKAIEDMHHIPEEILDLKVREAIELFNYSKEKVKIIIKG